MSSEEVSENSPSLIFDGDISEDDTLVNRSAEHDTGFGTDQE